MRRAAPIVGFVALVLLAGCGGGFGFAAETPSEDTVTDTPASLTPMPVPTDDPLSDPSPGLSEEGITDRFALANAHAEALTNTSLTLRRNRTLIAANGTRLVDITTVSRIGANHTHVMTEQTFNSTYERFFGIPVEHLDNWFNGTYGFYRLQGPNGTEYRALPSIGTGTTTLTGRDELLSYYLQAEATDVSTANGRILLRASVRPENKTGSASIPAVNVTERTVALTLTESGRVERYRTEYRGRLVNDPETTVAGVRVVRFTTVGETTVERPGWVPIARNASATPAPN